MELTRDGLMGGRVVIDQPRGGYRAGSDAILLAAAVPARPEQKVLDAGAGVGAVSLCLAARAARVQVRGVELQGDLVDLAAGNIAANKLADRVVILQGDIRQPPAEIGREVFAHTVCNPPFYAAGSTSASPDPGKAMAHGEGDTDLRDWIAFCLRRTVPGGTVTFIHRAERLDAILSGLRQGGGDLVVFPLWPKPGRPAKRVIVQAKVGGKGPTVLHPGLCLHHEDGRDTDEARAILRGGEPLDLIRAFSTFVESPC
ncbi:MAG: methyltransferase [Alphaproteobacteria bacterium]